MNNFFQHYIKPMRWFWLLIALSCASLFSMNYYGYRLFSTNQKTWSQSGSNGHK
ncbi:MAG: hypothetical protein JNM95_04145 [Chitinophagaceae bacterium]|nr:hypothetical protein [Chitinophagaceae bacterium]